MLLTIKCVIRKKLDIVANKIVWAGLSPNHLTLLGLLCSILAALFYLYQENILAAVFLLVGGSLDALDGALARVSNKVTKEGGIFDSTIDRLGEALIFIGIILGGYSSVFIGLSAMISSYLVSYIRGRAEVENVNIEGVGIGERPERILLLTVFTFLNRISLALLVLIIMNIITISQRIYYTHKILGTQVSFNMVKYHGKN
jgi:archaetidylinositol phosphate synthase